MGFMQAVKDKVIVEIIEEDKKTEGGLFLPETAKKEPQTYGKVISIGGEVEEIKEGDVLAFNERAGMDISFEGKKIKCLGLGEVYAIIKE